MGFDIPNDTRPVPDPFAEGTFEIVVDQVLKLHPGDEQGRMLRALGLKTCNKFYGFASGDYLVIKLPKNRVVELIEQGRGRPCAPRPDRPMKEWVQICEPNEKATLDYLLEARGFVASQIKKGT